MWGTCVREWSNQDPQVSKSRPGAPDVCAVPGPKVGHLGHPPNSYGIGTASFAGTVTVPVGVAAMYV
jgi:hypothetical protein